MYVTVYKQVFEITYLWIVHCYKQLNLAQIVNKLKNLPTNINTVTAQRAACEILINSV